MIPYYLYKNIVNGLVALILMICIAGCGNDQQNKNASIEDVAGNEDVLKFMKTFEGRGDLSDSLQLLSAKESLAAFRIPDDLSIDLVFAEPKITQPLFMCFDHRGRLWVVQYNQYPYPEGLKVMDMDQHIRAKYDKEPLPPPTGTKGADKITVFEDTDGDGKFDKSIDAITGLNIATSIAFGLGQIWVLSPPYLLAYPDPDNDGIPNGTPVVHLKGFGIEDTHSVANSLRWGPDGWLYGAQGSTCTADISSSVTKNIRFNGQAIWRYNPRTQIFELFAEGGGNTFDVEIDEKGRLYSGDNGWARGQYYKQGAYFPRNPGKHGAYTNPYAFGRLDNMVLKGEAIRFTHAFIKYEGGNFPGRYNDHMIALNPLQSYIQLTSFQPNGSSFITTDEERIVTTADHWFRPVDIVSGPDGAVYIADWSDSRLSHVDPRDTWNKNSGRIYRLRKKDSKENAEIFDLSKYSNRQLIGLLSHKNIWFRQQALQQFGDRKDGSVVPELMKLVDGGDNQTSLEALWAINLSGGFNDKVAEKGIHHRDPFIRMWTVRLLGDAGRVSDQMALQLNELAVSEKHPEVRSQLVATAKRLPGKSSVPILKNFIKGNDDSSDPDIPLQLWWAIESKVETNRNELVALFEDKTIWSCPVVSQTILERLMQRFVIAGGEENFAACARLLKLAPNEQSAGVLISGLQEGLRGRNVTELSPEMIKALQPYQRFFREESIAIELRQGRQQAVNKALEILADEKAKVTERLSYIRIFGEVSQPKAVPVLLSLMESPASSVAIQKSALLSLQRYEQDEIGERVVKAYPDRLRAVEDVRNAALSLCATRPVWAIQLLNAIAREKKEGETFIAHTIHKDDVPEQIVRQLKLLDKNEIIKMTDRIWPEIRLATSPEKNAVIARVSALMKAGRGDAVAGRMLYDIKCGACHKLFNEGGNIGPDLTGYDRSNLNDMLANIVDPAAFIREGYATFHVTTTDGRTLVGTLQSQSGHSVVIQPFAGEPVTLNTSQVKEMQPQKNSIMPERLLDGMTDQQIRDLLSYLMKPSE